MTLPLMALCHPHSLTAAGKLTAVLFATHPCGRVPICVAYSDLSDTLGLDARTVRTAVRDLMTLGWLTVEQSPGLPNLYSWVGPA